MDTRALPSRAAKAVATHDRPGDVTRRRAIVALALVGAGALGAVSLLQTGLVRHLPDPPPSGWFDSDFVNLSPAAFRFGVPDGVIGCASYALDVPLALAGGGADRARRRPWLSLVFAAKALGDALGAANYTLVEMPRLGVACACCIVAAACSFAILGLALPEARAAVRARFGV